MIISPWDMIEHNKKQEELYRQIMQRKADKRIAEELEKSLQAYKRYHGQYPWEKMK